MKYVRWGRTNCSGDATVVYSGEKTLSFYLTPLVKQFICDFLNPRTYTQIHAPNVVQGGGGGGGGWSPSPEFLTCCSISKRFYPWWKAFDFLNKTRYILLVVALLEACDITNNSSYLGRHLGFYQELEIRLKPQEIVIFLCFT